jgi:hypothetical protein
MIPTTIRRQHSHSREVPFRCRRSVNLLHQPYWLWLRCDACGHRVAVTLVPFIIRWGARRIIGGVAYACTVHGLWSAWGEPSASELGDTETGWDVFPLA